MAYKFCCDSYHVPKLDLYLLYYCNYIRVKYVTCATSWGRCSLIRLVYCDNYKNCVKNTKRRLFQIIFCGVLIVNVSSHLAIFSYQPPKLIFVKLSHWRGNCVLRSNKLLNLE